MGPVELLLLSAALQAGGNVLQKQRVAAQVPNVSLGQVTRRLGTFFGPLFRDPGWLLGAALGLGGALVGLQVLAKMDLSVLKALGRVGTAFMILAGVVFLGERLRARETFGLFLLLAGAISLGLGASESTGVAARGAHGLVAGGVGILLVAAALGQRWRTDWVRPELALAGAAGLLFGAGDILTKGATEVAKAGSGGGGFSVLEPASIRALVMAPEFAVAIVAYVAGWILIQAAFSVGRVSVIGPVTAIGSMLLPILFGLVVLHEDRTGDRLAGLGAVALGTLLLARERSPGSRGEPGRRMLRAPHR